MSRRLENVRGCLNLFKLNSRVSGAFRSSAALSCSYSTTIPRDSSQSSTIFSGIQPTGVPHLGNYLGALRPWRLLQDQASKGTQLFFSIVNLHALTVPENAGSLRKCTKEIAAALLAVGLDPKKSTIFCQSDVPAHPELMWILSTIASIGRLSKMTQWKSKLELPDGSEINSEGARAKLKLGLYSYPVLQAADILLYRATSVPVGEDQVQHLEFARNLANSFNETFKRQIFEPPQALISSAKRIMSLTSPRQKMSKSDTSASSRILINDSRALINQKISKALTDSDTNSITYDPHARPGIANLIDILRYTTNNDDPPEQIAHTFDEMQTTVKAKILKKAVIDAVDKELEDVRTRYNEIMEPCEPEDRNFYLADVLEEGRRTAEKAAGETMSLVREAVGLSGKDMNSR